MIACEEFVPDALAGGRNRFCGRCGRTRLLHALAAMRANDRVKAQVKDGKILTVRLVKEDDDAVR